MKKTFFIKIFLFFFCFIAIDQDVYARKVKKKVVESKPKDQSPEDLAVESGMNGCESKPSVVCADEGQVKIYSVDDLNPRSETPDFCFDPKFFPVSLLDQKTEQFDSLRASTITAYCSSKAMSFDGRKGCQNDVKITTQFEQVNAKYLNEASLMGPSASGVSPTPPPGLAEYEEKKEALENRCQCMSDNLQKMYYENVFHCEGLRELSEFNTGLFHAKNKQLAASNTIYVSSLSQFSCSSTGFAVDMAHCKQASSISDLFYLLMISSGVGQQFGLKAISEEDSKKIIARVQEMTKEVNPDTTDLNLFAFDTIISESNSQIDKLEWKLRTVGSFRLTLSALQMTWPNTRSYAQYCKNKGDSCKALLKRTNLMNNYILPNQAQLANLGRVIGEVDKELARLQDQINLHKNSIAANEKSRQQYLDSLNKDKEDEPVVDNKPLDCKENPFLVSCLGKEKSTEKEYAGSGKQAPIPDGREGVIPSKGGVDGATPGTSGDGKNGFIDNPSAPSLGGGGGGSPAGSGGGGGGGGGGGAGGGAGGAQPDKKKKNSAQPEVLKIGNVGDYGGKGGGKSGYSAGGNKSGSGSGSSDNPFDDMFGGKKKDGNEGGIHLRDIAASNEEMDEKNGVSNIFERISKIYQRSYDKKRIGIH